MKLIFNFIENYKKYALVDCLKRTFFYILRAFIAIVLYSILLGILSMLLDFNFYDSYGVIKNQTESLKPFELIVLNTLIFAPLVEETIFRLHLKISNKYFLISFFVLSITIIKAFFVSSILFYVLSTYAFVLLMIWYLSNKLNYNKVIFKINFIFGIAFFGLSHVSHIKIFDLHFWPIYLHYFIPMFIIGYYLSKIRIKLNLFYSILAHFVFNFIPIAIMIINRLV